MNEDLLIKQYPPMTARILDILKSNPPLLRFKSDAMSFLAQELYILAQQDPPDLPIKVQCWTAREACEVLSQDLGVIVWGFLNEVPVVIQDSPLQI